MSEQWEVVSKSRKQKNLDKKVIAHTEQKRIAAQLPKLEELLPTQRYRNLFGSSSNNNNKSHSPAKSSSSASSSSKTNKSPVKKNPVKNAGASSTQKKSTSSSVGKPKTLELALKSITRDDFAAQLEQVKLSCPGSELRWLSHIALYLNGALSYDCDPIFSGRSAQYPSVLASASLKYSVVEFLGSVGEQNLEYFFYSLLDSMATDLNNNQTVAGYKLVLQLIGQNWPSICSRNLAKTALLRNSYQNRSNICLSILWAIGQGGYQSLNEGVRVWQNLMLPNLELKQYTKFVVEYMERALSAAAARKPVDSLQLNQQEFFATYNALNATYNNLPKEWQQSLKRSARLLLQHYIDSPVKHANIFLTLFREISANSKQNNEIEGCISCLLSSGRDDCLRVWRMNYKKQQLPSLLLLKAIDDNWTTSTHELATSPVYHTFLQDVENLNEELQAGKRKDGNLESLKEVLLSVQEKSSAQQKKNKQNAAAQKKKCGCCKWTLGSIFIIALIAGALYYDTEVNGKGVFEKSATGKVLKNAGVLPHVQKTWYTVMGAGARGYKWAEVNVPPYAEPAIKTSGDLWKLARNAACNVYQNGKGYFGAKWPVVAKFIDQYVPNLSAKIEAFAAGASDFAVSSYEKSAVLIKEKVLVGRLSPENINLALNQTRNAALEYYNQFHKKVDAYAKLK
ncbi:transmembrane protein 214-A isoform X1 [Drosophila subpulchrella]|uniref:transmembrane protein 214-A isoform X1 n=1 Tax=Drosophila subpulchrella TaxID=1486046 RepID=UPI0018A1B26C|nr:transmembrane protein 214-A isoform X1 [Drosophila subpulchrella]